LLALLKKYPDNYYYEKLDDDVEDIICYKKYADKDDWKIVLPESMVPEVITWFHQVLGHPGHYHPQLRGQIDKFRCEHCQKYKLAGKDYGLLPITRTSKSSCALGNLGRSRSTRNHASLAH
jgi:hypothetical protein